MTLQKQVPLKDQERLDYFKRENIHLIQSKAYFASSLDAVLLADFIKLPHSRPFHYIDFCSGNGVIPLLLARKSHSPLTGLEIQSELVDMARRSVALNDLGDKVSFIEGDLKDFTRPLGIQYDIVSCNPPYFIVANSQEVHHQSSHAIARHEILLTMDDWVLKAKQVMRDRGKLYIVHRPDRLDDLFTTLLKYGFAVNRLRFVYPKVGSQANIILIEAIYQGGRHGVKVEPGLIVYQAPNVYSEEMQAIYYG